MSADDSTDGLYAYKVVVTGYAYGVDKADAEEAAAGGDWTALSIVVLDEQV